MHLVLTLFNHGLFFKSLNFRKKITLLPIVNQANVISSSQNGIDMQKLSWVKVKDKRGFSSSYHMLHSLPILLRIELKMFSKF